MTANGRLGTHQNYSAHPGPPFMFVIEKLDGFHPEMVLLPNLCVNRQPCLCDVLQYVSAQALDFLDLEQNSSFPIWKLYVCPSGISGWALDGGKVRIFPF
jgi:hypothetical protein